MVLQKNGSELSLLSLFSEAREYAVVPSVFCRVEVFQSKRPVALRS